MYAAFIQQCGETKETREKSHLGIFFQDINDAAQSRGDRVKDHGIESVTSLGKTRSVYNQWTSVYSR